VVAMGPAWADWMTMPPRMLMGRVRAALRSGLPIRVGIHEEAAVRGVWSGSHRPYR
jgi:hypothetical protein